MPRPPGPTRAAARPTCPALPPEALPLGESSTRSHEASPPPPGALPPLPEASVPPGEALPPSDGWVGSSWPDGRVFLVSPTPALDRRPEASSSSSGPAVPALPPPVGPCGTGGCGGVAPAPAAMSLPPPWTSCLAIQRTHSYRSRCVSSVSPGKRGNHRGGYASSSMSSPPRTARLGRRLTGRHGRSDSVGLNTPRTRTTCSNPICFNHFQPQSNLRS